MLIRTSLPEEYYRVFPTPRNVYGSRAFNEVTACNADAVRYFIGYDDKSRPRLGLIAGYNGGEWHAPYSAPFAEIAYDKPQQLEHIYDFISELTHMLGAPLHISLPPEFYDPLMMPKLAGVIGNYASRKHVDFDYYYPLERFNDFSSYLDRAARKNYSRACLQNFAFSKTDDIDTAYAIIRANRDSHGYPLAMTLAQVKATMAAIGGDAFVLSAGHDNVAAAIVYHTADLIAQVIYWGDAPGYSEKRPMNILPYHVFKYYHDKGYTIIDIGPSSVNGIPNTGLCRFKESIGCAVALKPSFTLF